jgi:hypothetical protein
MPGCPVATAFSVLMLTNGQILLKPCERLLILSGWFPWLCYAVTTGQGRQRCAAPAAWLCP